LNWHSDNDATRCPDIVVIGVLLVGSVALTPVSAAARQRQPSPPAVPARPTSTAFTDGGGNQGMSVESLAVVLVVVGLGAVGLTRIRRQNSSQAAPRPELKAFKDLGRQTITLDRPAIVFHAQFGSWG
jgi:hypothetical protein